MIVHEKNLTQIFPQSSDKKGRKCTDPFLQSLNPVTLQVYTLSTVISNVSRTRRHELFMIRHDNM